MKTAHQKQTLTTYQQVTINLDLKDLLSSAGKYSQKIEAIKNATSVLYTISVGVFILSLLVLLTANQSSVNFLTLLSIAVILACYSHYLQSKYQLNKYKQAKPLNWVDLKSTSVNVQDYLNIDLVAAIDYEYFNNQTSFLHKLSLTLLTKPEVLSLISRLGIDKSEFIKTLDVYLLSKSTDFESNYKGLLGSAFIQAVNLNQSEVDYITISLLLLKSLWLDHLATYKVTKQEVDSLEVWLKNSYLKQNYKQVWQELSLLKPRGSVNRAYTSKYSSLIETYGEDLTLKSANGLFNLCIARETELTTILRILQKDHNPGVIVLGEPGVGKSRLIQHLAVRLVVEDVPEALKDKRLVAINLVKVFTELKSIEQFKQFLQDLFIQVAKTGNIILVLEDLEQALEVRQDLRQEIINILEDGISSKGIKVVATTNPTAYTQLIKPQRQLAAIFEPVVMAEPANNIALQILIDCVPDLEAKYGVQVQVQAIKQAVSLSSQYAYQRVMPDKAIDLLEESILQARTEGLNFLNAATVSAIVSGKVGVSVGQISSQESEKLMNIELSMQKRVVGQDVAIKAVASALRRSRAGLSNTSKPIASFLFFGPTGVGKTEVAKALAQTYYGSEKLMVRLDMSEYQEEQNLSRLIGKLENNQLVGGFLTEAIRSKPFSLLLLDEIEKANPKILDLFLQILDEGYVTDGAGKKVSFSNVIVIATSNASSQQIADLTESGSTYAETEKQVLPVLRQVFKVEFLNRFDKIIMFKPLLITDLTKIAQIALVKIASNLLDRGMHLEYSERVLNDLVTMAYNPLYGARELNRVVQEQIESKLAELIVKGELVSGKGVRFNSLDSVEVV